MDSLFQETHGFYVHGVGPETATLPSGWETRLIPVHGPLTDGNTGWCLEAHDLAASKLAAGRDKDLEYVAALFRHGLADPEEVVRRAATLPVSSAYSSAARQITVQRAQRLAREARGTDAA